MARSRKKSKWGGVVIGPILVCIALLAIWKNETRFDYGRAAAATTAVSQPAEASSGDVISLTGSMDQKLAYPGGYVDAFTGYLTVWRYAEIYAWDKDEDDDGTTWTLEWMSSLENNSRNRSVRQRLKSTQFFPDQFNVGELTIDKKLIEFVDPSRSIDPGTLTLSDAGEDLALQSRVDYFYLEKHAPSKLGDERVHYVGITVPATATYFGKYGSGRGVADQTHRRTGLVNKLIRDSGVLHHIVAGDRSVAISTMKGHIRRLKWFVRGCGTGIVVIGFLIFFSSIVGFLFHLPLIGSVAQAGAFVLSIAVGIPLAMLTMMLGFMASHPVLLVLILGGTVAAIFLLQKRGAESQISLKRTLDREHGHELDSSELTDMEFIELAHLAFSDSKFGSNEEKVLQRWAKKHRWDDAKYQAMIKQAKASIPDDHGKADSGRHLESLIRLAMADGLLSSYEVKVIRQVSQRVGYDSAALQQIIRRVRSEARA